MSATLDFARNDRIMRFFVSHPQWFGTYHKCVAVGGISCLPALFVSLAESYWLRTRPPLWNCEKIYFFLNYIFVVPFLLWLTQAIFRDIEKIFNTMCTERLFLVTHTDLRDYYKRFERMMDGRFYSLVFFTLLVAEIYIFSTQVIGLDKALDVSKCNFSPLSHYGNYIWAYSSIAFISITLVVLLIINTNIRTAKNKWILSLLLILLIAGYYFSCLKNVLAYEHGNDTVRSISMTDFVHLPIAFISLYLVVQSFGRLIIFVISFDDFFKKLKVNIEPYHSDMCCGFSSVGIFIIKYILLSSIVSATILITYYMFSILEDSPYDKYNATTLMFAMLAVEIMFIRLFFWRIHKAMKLRRTDMLDEINMRYNKILSECYNCTLDDCHLDKAKKLQDVRNHILEYNTYPLQLSEILKFILPGSAIQLITFFMQFYGKIFK